MQALEAAPLAHAQDLLEAAADGLGTSGVGYPPLERAGRASLEEVVRRAASPSPRTARGAASRRSARARRRAAQGRRAGCRWSSASVAPSHVNSRSSPRGIGVKLDDLDRHPPTAQTSSRRTADGAIRRVDRARERGCAAARDRRRSPPSTTSRPSGSATNSDLVARHPGRGHGHDGVPLALPRDAR